MRNPVCTTVGASIGVAGLTIIVGAPSASFGQLALYDNFNNAALSSSLWTKNVAGAGTVTFSGTNAVIDMSSPTAGKAAHMLFPMTPTLAGLGGSLDVTWDQQITVDGANGFDSGFGIVSGSTDFDAGQRGAVSSNSSYHPHNFLISNGTYGVVNGGTAEHHYSLVVTPTTSTLKIYQYNSAFDSSPGSYVSSGTLLETLASTPDISFSATAPLQMMFFSEDEAGSDPYSSFNVRSAISVDNVFTNLPEPTSASMIAVLGLGIRRRRRRRPV